MADRQHVKILSKGIPYWNAWRQDNPLISPDLSNEHVIVGATQSKIKGESVDARSINFKGVNFFQSSLESMHLDDVDLSGSNFYEADLSYAKLRRANLTGCNFRKTYLSYANLEGAKLINVNLNRANLVHANLEGATLENSIVYGVSAWGVITNENTAQRNLILEDTNFAGDGLIEYFSRQDHYPLMVHDIEIAQFIHLMTNNKSLGKALNAMIDKGVLILGKFRDQGRELLEFVATRLKSRNFIPIIFDFQNPEENKIIETVTVLAGISRFIVVDLSGPSVPAELERITSTYSRPIISFTKETNEDKVYAMFSDLLRKRQVLFLRYTSLDELENKLDEKLKEAERIMQELIKEGSETALTKLRNG